MMEISSIEHIECHLNWKPATGSTKFDIGDVIKKVENKMEGKERHLKVGHLATLAYLYTVESPLADIHKAEQYLDEAHHLNETIRGTSEPHQFASEFVVKANQLLLKKMRGPQSSRNRHFRQELTDLKRLWEDKDNRAVVFAIKGATFNCFGPVKYQEGVRAYELALDFDSNPIRRYHWLAGQAKLMSRITRLKQNKLATKEELRIWQLANESRKSLKISDPIFLACYAEAVLYTRELGHLCRQLMEEADFLVQKIPRGELEHFHIVFIIGFKVYRHLRMQRERQNLLRRAVDVVRCTRDPGFCLEVANECKRNGDKEKAIELLQKGKELAQSTGHLWIDLRLIELQQFSKGLEWSVAMYDSLMRKPQYLVFPANAANILIRKAFFILRHRDGSNEVAMEICIESFEKDPEVLKNSKWMATEILALLKDKSRSRCCEKYVGWMLDHVLPDDKVPHAAEVWYRQSLQQKPEDEFTLEYLGRHYLKRQELKSAAECFSKLPDDNEMRDQLWCKALLSNDSSSLTDLEFCLELGCKDACLAILTRLEKHKESTDVRSEVMNRVSRSQSLDADPPIFFSTRVYTLCAKMTLTVEDGDSSFLLNDSENCDFANDVCDRVKRLLEVAPLASATSASASDRGNLMRNSRLQATRCFLMEPSDESEVHNATVQILKEAKEILDRSFAELFRSRGNKQFSYIHAFDTLKAELKKKKDFNVEQKAAQSEGDRKAMEMERLLKLLLTEKELTTKKKVKDALKRGFVKVDKNIDTKEETRDVFDFLADRERRILTRESGWLIRWIYSVNNEKHDREIRVLQLNQGLKRDMEVSGESGSERSAYHLAHLAAEFAEETWAVMATHKQRVTAGGDEHEM